jgi:hypothetical protein
MGRKVMNFIMKYGKRILALATIIIATFSSFIGNTISTSTIDRIGKAIDSAFAYKCSQLSADNTQQFLNELSKNAGDYSSDWYYIALSRYGVNCNNESSIEALTSAVDGFYKEDLENVKATDMQRVALALLSCDVDIKNVNGHNLLADCTYNRENYAPLDKQGVNSLAFALLLLDSKSYSVPKDAKLSRNDIIAKILEKELTNGGFAIVGDNPDVDATAIVLQSLAPYYKNDDVKPVVDRALAYLSKVQADSGAFKSYGKENAESTAQTIIALNSLNIDIFNDSRFIKNNNTALDGLMNFSMSDGGFCHIQGYATDNMATYQSLCALISCYRYLNNQGSFYDFNPQKTITHKVNPTTAKNSKSSSKTKSSQSKSTAKATEPTEKTKSTEQQVKTTETENQTSIASKTINSSETEKTAQTDAKIVENNKFYKINRTKSIVTENKYIPLEIILVFVALVVSFVILFYIKSRGSKK